jgi:predicted nucleic acid-binding protein
MKVLVDTCIWSLAFRKRVKTASDNKITDTLVELVQDLRVVMIGPIRQEILSGIRDETQFEKVSERIRPFADIGLESEDFELAARHFNRCRGKGIQGSNTDFLICAVAERRKLAVFTLDKDFMRYQKVLGINLYKAPKNTNQS